MNIEFTYNNFLIRNFANTWKYATDFDLQNFEWYKMLGYALPTCFILLSFVYFRFKFFQCANMCEYFEYFHSYPAIRAVGEINKSGIIKIGLKVFSSLNYENNTTFLIFINIGHITNKKQILICMYIVYWLVKKGN